MPHNVVFFVYPGFVQLGLSGLFGALAAAESIAPGSYRLTVVSPEGGPVTSASGLVIMTEKAADQAVDTLVAVGDFGLAEGPIEREWIDFLRAASSRARRTTSVCMGAFLLAACGLLDGRRATTHWRYAARLQALYPRIRVDGDCIFIADAGVWTSAGMTASIDMTLALIEEDLGAGVACAVARLLVVYYRRPGCQYQFSSLLELDAESDRIRAVLAYARENISETLSVEQLADVAHLSVRQFSRAFVASTGMTPAKAIERLRVEIARPRVEEGREPLSVIAQSVGIANPQRLSQSFIRVLGRTPQELRRIARAE